MSIEATDRRQYLRSITCFGLPLCLLLVPTNEAFTPSIRLFLVTLRMPWRKIDAGPLNEEDAKALTTWLTEIGQADDFLVIEGPDDAIEPILQEARALSLIAMRPVWTPAPAFIPLIGDDPE